jgi:hypothetical protein
MGRNTSPNYETTAILCMSTIPRWWRHPITINTLMIKNLFASQLPPTCPYGYQLDRHKQIFGWKLELTPKYANACVRGPCTSIPQYLRNEIKKLSKLREERIYLQVNYHQLVYMATG